MTRVVSEKKMFANMGEKCGEVLTSFLPMCVLQFPGKVATRYSMKILHTMHSAQNKILSLLEIGSWGAQGLLTFA